jgi:hypothetical protein
MSKPSRAALHTIAMVALVAIYLLASLSRGRFIVPPSGQTSGFFMLMGAIVIASSLTLVCSATNDAGLAPAALSSP